MLNYLRTKLKHGPKDQGLVGGQCPSGVHVACLVEGQGCFGMDAGRGHCVGPPPTAAVLRAAGDKAELPVLECISFKVI